MSPKLLKRLKTAAANPAIRPGLRCKLEEIIARAEREEAARAQATEFRRGRWRPC